MMTFLSKRLWVTFAILTTGFCSVLIVPHSGKRLLTKLKRDLPGTVANWSSEPLTISGQERKQLAAGTEFERRAYFDLAQSLKYDIRDGKLHNTFTGDSYEKILPEQINEIRQETTPVTASIVFSGVDINNSIHRPEVCLRVQGWNFVSERHLILKGVLPDGGDLPVKEIVAVKPRHKKMINPEDGSKPIEDKSYQYEINGEKIVDMMVQYHTFVGHDVITDSVYRRTLVDIKDRLLKGVDQQWAYVTFSTTVSQHLVDQGILIPEKQRQSLEQSREAMQKLIKQLMPKMLKK